MQAYGSAVAIEYLSTKEEDGRVIFVEHGENVGYLISYIPDKENVKIISYKNKIYFIKDVAINTRILELRDKIGGVIASHILNHIFKGKDKRYPFLKLAFNPEYDGEETFYVLSEKLEEFTSIETMQPYEKAEIKANDLENLYMGIYLIGSGDPHMRNIFYNPTNYHLGSVDLDVSFKEHTGYHTQRRYNEKTTPDFFKKYSDLAIRTINCNNIFTNFLFVTDSMLSRKVPYHSRRT